MRSSHGCGEYCILAKSGPRKRTRKRNKEKRRCCPVPRRCDLAPPEPIGACGGHHERRAHRSARRRPPHAHAHRPERRNALDTAMLESLVVATRRAATNPAVSAVMLTGAGGTFCVGGDVKAM